MLHWAARYTSFEDLALNDPAYDNFSSNNQKLSRPTIAEINLQALKNNVKKLKKISTSKLYPVVKANAYGHGLKQVIKTINNLVSGFCVATFEEAIELKKVNDQKCLMYGGTL